MHSRRRAHEETALRVHLQALLDALLRDPHLLLQRLELLLDRVEGIASLVDAVLDLLAELRKLAVGLLDDHNKVRLGLAHRRREVQDHLPNLLAELLVHLVHGLANAIEGPGKVVIPLKVLVAQLLDAGRVPVESLLHRDPRCLIKPSLIVELQHEALELIYIHHVHLGWPLCSGVLRHLALWPCHRPRRCRPRRCSRRCSCCRSCS